MSHYPSSAELATFRKRLGAPFSIPYGRGAFPSERVGGIGYTGGRPTAPFLLHDADDGPFPMGYAVPAYVADGYDHSWARRAASAMRHRAFTRTFGGDVTWPEITAFVPEVPYRGTRLNGFPDSIWPR